VVASGISTIFCADPQEISLLYFLWLAKAGGGLKRVVGMYLLRLSYLKLLNSLKLFLDAENGAQERKFEGGSQSISDGLAAKLGKVYLP